MANPTLLEMPIARDGAKNSIPSTTSPTTGLLSQQYGWQDINSMPVQQGGKAPSRLDFNGVLNLLSNILFYAQKGWQFEWDSSQAYYAGCIVKDTSDGKMYRAINDVTSTTAPHADTTNWKVWDLSMLADYLPLSGGNMTGTFIARNVDNSLLGIYGGSDINKGAYAQFYSKDHASIAGGYVIEANDGNNSTQLCSLPNGSLKIATDIAGVYTETDLAGSAIVAKSLGANGYVKRASGEIVQFGHFGTNEMTDGGPYLYKTIQLPITYEYTVNWAGASFVATTGFLGNVEAQCGANKTNLTVYVKPTNIGAYQVSWITIGR